MARPAGVLAVFRLGEREKFGASVRIWKTQIDFGSPASVAWNLGSLLRDFSVFPAPLADCMPFFILPKRYTHDATPRM